jgi:hypothetical protein
MAPSIILSPVLMRVRRNKKAQRDSWARDSCACGDKTLMGNPRILGASRREIKAGRGRHGVLRRSEDPQKMLRLDMVAVVCFE